MSVIIRLQNLPWSANALDIRQYFHGLGIPEGGVHIVGGELGDAFIAFSTDEDARQAFTRNNGKIKEVQISLMLSSRTEMQRVIEGARAQSYAAFMQAAPSAVPLPAAVPSIVPAAVPEVRRESKEKMEKRDKRRSRSKSREKKDRSRDRDRKDKRHRDRSRSRSRDRKNRNRRDRSRSRGRSRSRERDRKTRDRRRRSDERSNSNFRDARKPPGDVWPNQNKPLDVGASGPQSSNILTGGMAAAVMDQAKRPLGNLAGNVQTQSNGFPPTSFNNGNRGNSRDNWPPNPNFNNRNHDNFQNQQDQPPFPGRYQRNNFPSRGSNRVEHDFKDCCISVEPFYGGYGDIRRFFQGMFISNKGIKFINDCNGRRTGIVYVQLGNRKNMEEALSLDGENLNGINVSVTRIDDQEFEDAVDRYLPAMNNEDGSNDGSFKYKSRNQTKFFHNPTTDAPDLKDYSCLTVEDLPTYCKEQDILHMFSQLPLLALILTTKKRGGYIAYVKFSSKEVAKKAYEEKSHHIVGGKPVTVKPCKDEEFNEINRQHDVNLNSPKTEDVNTDCVHISMLPPKTTDKDIADFFSDIGVNPTKIHLINNNLGFTGEAYCEFMNTEDVARALKKNETILGKTVVTVVPVNREEMANNLGTSLPNPDMMEPRVIMNPLPLPSSGPNSMRMHNPNRPQFFNRNFDNGPRGQMRFGPRGPPRHRFPPPDLDEVPPGCTVYMKNVPYKAGTNEILQLFDGYNHTRNVSRRYNPNNTPTDEAKITFFDAEDASRAVEELNKAKIWDRPIFLKQD